MDVIKRRLTWAAVLLLALGLCVLLPRALESGRLLTAQDDPAALADIGLDVRFDAVLAHNEIENALATGDLDLAQSFIALADDRHVAVDAGLRARVAAKAASEASALAMAGGFAEGFVTGDPEDAAQLAGTIAGDLFVFGDVRDVVREGMHAARGEEVNELILGLACVGLVVTAGTYATLGAGTPARVGLSVVKAASRAGRMTARMSAGVLRPLRDVIDHAALAKAIGPSAIVQPVTVIRAARKSVKVEKMQGVLEVVADVGRVRAKAGTRAALDGLKLAEGPKDMTRIATLAAAKGGKTRAILKVLGRGAIALTLGIWELASWLFWAALMLLGWCISLKRLTERAALRFFRWRKRSRAVLAAA